MAAAAAQDGHIVQFLAGAPELLARYRNASPAAAALINAAMDARRLGMGADLPQAFLADAALGYLTDAEWDGLGEDWLEQALAYTAVPCKGIRGPLTRIRPRAMSRAVRPGSQGSDKQVASDQGSVPTLPIYRLADYLDQYGRRHRENYFPPESFWAAVPNHASLADQAAVGNAAQGLGLYRYASQLRENVIAHISLDDPFAVAGLLDSLRAAGAEEQVTALAARAAASIPLDDPDDVTRLLDSLRAAGAEDQVTAVAARAAAQPHEKARFWSRRARPDSPQSDVEAFYRTHYSKLLANAMYIGATKEDAEDAVESAIIAMLPRWGEIQNPYRYARNIITHELIKQRSRSRWAGRRMLESGIGARGR
jgi:hypothetical protein